MMGCLHCLACSLLAAVLVPAAVPVTAIVYLLMWMGDMQ